MERTPRNGDCDNTLWFKIALSGVGGLTPPTPPVPPLLPPENVTATGVSIVEINVTWTDPNVDETGYRVSRASVIGGPYSVVATLPAGSTSYQDLDVTESSTWFYIVTALRGAEEAPAPAPTSGTALTFTPPQLADLQQWLRSDVIPGAAEGVGVETWPDQSAGGNDGVQLAVLSRPVYFEGVLNNLPGVYFDGSTFMESTLLSTATTMTMFAVLRFDSAAAGAIQTVYKNGNNGGFAFLRTATPNREILLRAVADCVDGAVTTNTEYWTGRTTAAPLTSLRVNGVGQALTNSASVPIAPDGGSHIGNFDGGSFPMVGYIFEVLYYDTALSDADRNLVEEYLALKYAL